MLIGTRRGARDWALLVTSMRRPTRGLRSAEMDALEEMRDGSISGRAFARARDMGVDLAEGLGRAVPDLTQFTGLAGHLIGAGTRVSERSHRRGGRSGGRR